MGLHYVNLDDETRVSMAAEVDLDTRVQTLYISNYLSAVGAETWPQLLSEAARLHNDDWLARELAIGGRLKREVERRKPKGGFTIVAVPVTAPITLAEGEFNRYYLRGLCLRAIERGTDALIIYRARASTDPRPESEALVGTTISAERLLVDLRANPGVDTALGLAKPNSGLSARLML